jgi:hypothetical protein
MDLQTRKISFVQEFLTIENEEIISSLESLLKKEKKANKNKEFSPMTMEEFQNRIDRSMEDSEDGRLKSSKDLLKEIRKWG